ncbi:MAG: CoA-binding protein [Bacteroidales bacterium]|nr:CoA-binding protein [Bacteroidales bacterium]
MKANLNQIENFLASKNIGLVGVSRNPKKFGNEVMKQLLKNGYKITAVHREAQSIEDVPCVNSIAALPSDTEAICLITPKTETDVLLRAAIDKGFKNIWIQQFSEGSETFSIIKNTDANVVTGRCIFMYTNPEGFHKFHERINKLFGTFAK